MLITSTQKDLFERISEIEVIDAHEHLPTEKDYLSNNFSGMNFFAGYIWVDLARAGIDMEFKKHMRDPGYHDVNEWWPKISPYWKYVKYGSYARAAIITARDLYGIDEINDETILDLQKAIMADNKKGLYKKIMQDKCNIRVALSTEISHLSTSDEDSFFRVTPFSNYDINKDNYMDRLQRLMDTVGIYPMSTT